MPDRPDAFDVYPADTSLDAVLAELGGLGFTGQFEIGDDGSCTCLGCGTSSAPDAVRFEHRRRLEGASDPGEMTNVLALTCPHCAANGVAVCRFGPEAGAGEAAFLQAARGQLGP